MFDSNKQTDEVPNLENRYISEVMDTVNFTFLNTYCSIDVAAFPSALKEVRDTLFPEAPCIIKGQYVAAAYIQSVSKQRHEYTGDEIRGILGKNNMLFW